MTRRCISYISLILFLCVSLTVEAQTFSYDGNRWYEIEVSIFTNEYPREQNEKLIPRNTQLSYFQPMIQLTPASQSFQVFFEERDADSSPDPFFGNEVEQTKIIGPENSVDESNFRIADFNRDPFIALGNESARFLDYNLDIIDSGDHRLLFHAVWRQPALNRSQATAVFIEGGSEYGEHHELEGNLRFSYNVNRVDVEASLWLSEFDTSPTAEFASWELPTIPYQSISTQGLRFGQTVNYYLDHLVYMNQERAMISNELHFLDHPELGLLVEIRPYQLPEPNDFID